MFKQKRKANTPEDEKVGKKARGCWWTYYPVGCVDHRQVFQRLRPRCATTKKQVVIYGQTFDEPRTTIFFSLDGHKYHYSGLTHDSKGWFSDLQTLMYRTYQLTGECYDAALMNLYKHGGEYISVHNDKDAIPNLPVASWSFGQSRPFVIKSKDKKEVVHTQELESGSLFVMERGCQERFTHELPKRSPNKYPGERINVTFRRHFADTCDLMKVLFGVFGNQSWLPTLAQFVLHRPTQTRA